MGAMASQISCLTTVYSTVYSGTDQRKHQSSASLAFVRGIHRWSVNSPHKWPITRKMFPFDDVIMSWNTPCMLYGVHLRLVHLNLSVNVLRFHVDMLCMPVNANMAMCYTFDAFKVPLLKFLIIVFYIDITWQSVHKIIGNHPSLPLNCTNEICIEFRYHIGNRHITDH